MRRSICYCDPSVALAGEDRDWRFIYTTATSLPKGTILRFDLMSEGRVIDWQIPTTNLRKTANVIFATLPNGKILSAEEVIIEETNLPCFEFTLPCKLEAGKDFVIQLGRQKAVKTEDANHSQAQTFVQRRRPFMLYVDPTGKGHFEDPEVFTMDIRGNTLEHVRILAPSFAVRNKRFDVTVRFEDAFGNLTANAPEDTLIELSYENLRENLNWKLFIPETGFINLPNLYFNEVGVYTIELKNLTTGDLFRSAPIRCFQDNPNHLFWGTLHGESERIDSTENIESCLRYFRDDLAHNFFISTPFASDEETPPDTWKTISQNILEFGEDERFTTLTGCQWVGKPKSEGVRIMVHAKELKAPINYEDTKSNSLKKVYKLFNSGELLSIPSFTMGKGYSYDFNAYEPNFERVVEIYNSWGSSEDTAKNGNTLPIQKTSGRGGVTGLAEGAVISALNKGCRFGFVAGGLDDRGIYANFFDNGQEQYYPGLTVVISDTHSKEALFNALYNRHCYATTGQRIILGMEIAGAPIGAEISTQDKPGLSVNRHISGYAAGCCPLEKVEIIRNGEVLTTLTSDTYHLDFTYDDLIDLEKVCLSTSKKKGEGFCYYYLRVTQEDGHMAWSSPIWVDMKKS